METIDHECYVSYEVAKLLKEEGFDLKCNGVFISEDGNQYAFIKADAACDNNNSKYNPYNISAPTFDVAQRWLREVKNVSIEVKTCRWVNRHQDGKYTVSYRHELWPIDTSIVPNDEDKFICYTIDYACNIEFQTYEEALEAGIKKALELILEKEE